MNRLLNGTVHPAAPIKGSRFRATVVVVDTVDAAMAALGRIRAADPDATHHCWAFRLANGAVRCSDDGEPSGTAGRPILARLEGREVVDALVVVTRWYGGTKLGAGGLVRAYGRTAGDALAECLMQPWAPMVPLVLEYDYADAGAVDGVLQGETTYGARVRRIASVPASTREALIAALQEATGGRVDVG